ncbi:MAG: hypothetical protein LWX83_11215 [Anaerolineae bacterium]|nr:hypothetical protein [Anaerolineae bacterium]
METEPKLTLTPPNFLTAFKNGFNAVANHVQIIIFPILLDLMLLFGPQLRVKKLLEPFLDELIKFGQTSSMAQQFPIAEQNQAFDALKEYVGHINIFSMLSTFPIGIPSIMAPGIVENPLGLPMDINFSSSLSLLACMLALYLLGLFLATLFYNRLCALSSNAGDRFSFKTLAWQFIQVLSFSIWLFLILFVIILPVTFILSIIQLFSAVIGQILLFLFVFLLLWLGFPLIFTPHGIFAYNQNVFSAAFTSYRLVRFALPNSSLFISIVILLYLGSLGLWFIPPENSWLILAGIVGHAFLFSGLLVSTFYYYRGSINWMRELFKRSAQPPVRTI